MFEPYQSRAVRWAGRLQLIDHVGRWIDVAAAVVLTIVVAAVVLRVLLLAF